MGHKKNAMFVEASVVSKFCEGSYEERLQILEDTVGDNSDMFGGGEIALLASHPDYVAVVNDSGQFFSASYVIEDGVVSLGKVTSMNVGVMNEDEIVKKGVDDFFESGSLASGLRSIAGMDGDQTNSMSPMERATKDMERLFKEQRHWQQVIADNRDKVLSEMEDSDELSIENIAPVFEEEYKELSEEWREIVTAELVDMDEAIHSELASIEKEYETYQAGNETSLRGEREDEMLSLFEAFASDFIEHFSEVARYVSGAVVESRKSCVTCAAMVHDEIATKLGEMAIAGRFVRQMLSQF